MNGIELRLKHIEIVQQKGKEEGIKVLKEIWEEKKNRGKTLISVGSESKEEIKVEKTIKVEPKEEIKPLPIIETLYNTIDDLEKIKGIGKETVEDIKILFKDIDTLKQHLIEGKRLPFRNDVKPKLKEALKIN